MNGNKRFSVHGIGSETVHGKEQSERGPAADHPGRMLLCVLTGLVTAVIPFLAYTLSLRSVEASKAGILATVEPLVATLFGIIVFSEPITLLSGLGIALILAAVILLNRGTSEPSPRSTIVKGKREV